MPYHHAKKPQQLDLALPGEGYRRPLMQIGELRGNVIVGAGGTVGLSIFDQPEKPNEINGETVRLPDGEVAQERNALPAKGSAPESS
jgi:hypothetical protein